MKKVLYTGTILLSLGALWTSGVENSYADSFSDELIVAVERNQAAKVYKIIRKGASVDKRGKYQNTALIKSAAAGYLEIGKILIENGADVNLQNLSGASALHRAAGNGNIDFIKLLLDKKADINIKDGEGWTPLMTATARKRADVVNLLVKHGADIEATSFFGENALHLAVKVRSEDMVNLLLEAGSDPMSKNSKGQTAYEIADEKSLALATIITSHTNKKSTESSENTSGSVGKAKTYNEFVDQIDSAEQSQLYALQDAEKAFKDAAAEIKAAKIMADIKNVEAQLKIEKAKEELSKIRLRREIAEQAMLSRKAAKEKKIRMENLARIEAEKELERIARENKIKEARRIVLEEDERIRKLSQAGHNEVPVISGADSEIKTEEENVTSNSASDTKSNETKNDQNQIAASESSLKEKIESARKEAIKEERKKIAQENTNLRKSIEQDVRKVLNSEFSQKVAEFEKRQKEANDSLAKMKESINAQIEKANAMVAEKNKEIEQLKQYASALEIKQVKLLKKIQAFIRSDSTKSNNDNISSESPTAVEPSQINNDENKADNNVDVSDNKQNDSSSKSSSNIANNNIIKEDDKSEDLTIKELDRISRIEKKIMALEVTRKQKLLESNIALTDNNTDNKTNSQAKNITLAENTKRKRRRPPGNQKNIQKVKKKEIKQIFVPKVKEDKVISKNWWESKDDSNSKESLIEDTPTDSNNDNSIDVVAPDIPSANMSNEEIDQTREGAIERLKQAKDDIISDVGEKEISDEELDAITDIDSGDNVFEGNGIGEPVTNQNSVAEEVVPDNSMETNTDESIDAPIETQKPEEIKEIEEKMNQVENKSTARFKRIAALKRLKAARDKIARSAEKNNTRKISSKQLFNNELKEIASANINSDEKRKNVIREARKRAYDIINKNKNNKTVPVVQNKKPITSVESNKRTNFLANLEKELSKPNKKAQKLASSTSSGGGRSISKLPWKKSAEKDSPSIDDASIKITKIRPIDGNYAVKNTNDQNRKNIEKIAKIIASIESSSKSITSASDDKDNDVLANSGSIGNSSSKTKTAKLAPSFNNTNGEFKVRFTNKPLSMRGKSSSGYWLKIGNFVDSRTAYQHYKNVTSEYVITGLQYRPIYSAKPGMNNVSFKVGPLKSINEASKLCMKFRGDNLGCSTVATAK